jgi:hypothetical protein
MTRPLNDGEPLTSPSTNHPQNNVLGDQAYESCARKGEAMSAAAIVAYAYDQIDQARAELNTVSK